MKNLIVGAWDLQSFEITDKEKITRSWGENTRGLLIYTATGEVSVSINRDIVSAESNDFLDSILFYSGTHIVEGNVVTHNVIVASSPERVGRKLIRYAELNGDLLLLTTPEESYGKATLLWKRRQH